MKKEEVINKYGLIPHPEGGYFKEICKSDIKFNDEQSLYSSILFLLGENDISHLHVLKEDELWYYQGGDDCTIIEIDENMNLKEIHLGTQHKDSVIQHLVKKGKIFGSKCEGKNYTLVGCMVSPSFTYNHFYLVKENELKDKLSKETLEKIKDMFIE